MTLWIVPYVLAMLGTTRITYVRLTRREEEHNEIDFPIQALFVGLFWPIAALVVSLKYTVFLPTPTQRQRRADERTAQDWAALERMADKLDIPVVRKSEIIKKVD